MKNQDNLIELEKKLGWTFANRSYLVEALTHSSYANENPSHGANNERLEFLGDAVIDLIVARLLFESMTDVNEGEMSRRRARVVRRESLANLAKNLDLGTHLLLGLGQKRAGKTDGILADAFEALAGAVFLDGGFVAASNCFSSLLVDAIEAASKRVDFKTQLQELCHRYKLSIPGYQVTDQNGPDHAQCFQCKVIIQGEVLGLGSGPSKKAAEQVCAQQALEILTSRYLPA